MKKKLSIYKINDPIFEAPLSLFIGDRELFNNKLKKLGGGLENHLAVGIGKTLLDYDRKFFIVWTKEINSTLGMSILLHELIHHIFNVFSVRGIISNADNDEVFAYYYSMLYRNIIKKVKKH